MRNRPVALCLLCAGVLALVSCGGSGANLTPVATTTPTTPSTPSTPASAPVVVNVAAGRPSPTAPSDCGATWADTLQQLSHTTSKVDTVQIVSWNDYEQGSQLERGIDNCVTLNASVTDSTLNWTADGNTALIDHYETYSSTDGVNLTGIASLAPAQTSLDLAAASLTPGRQYYLYVAAIGKPSVQTKLSPAVTVVLPAPIPPSVVLSVLPLSGIAPVAVTAATTPSFPAADPVASSSIDFGDGTVVHTASASHTYSAPGSFTVRATLTSRSGATTTSSSVVSVVANQPPIAKLALSPTTGIAPLAVKADTSASTDPDGSIASRTIDFGDGTVAAAATASHTYSLAGAYTVKATVIDNAGLAASTSTTVVVSPVAPPNQPPVVSLAVTPLTGEAPIAVTADTAGSTDADGSIAARTIDFGDGTIVTAASASHTYAAAGSYTVKATLTDNLGLAAFATKSVTVNAPPPPPPTAGATWYIRADGGTRTQCTGTTDAAYPGSGSNRPCALNDLRYLWTDGTANGKWKIAGGDTVLLRGGPWRVGYNGPNPKDSFDGYKPGDPYSSYNPPIPAGTAAQHTRILGENYASCTSKTQIFGGYADAITLNLKGTQYVEVQCIELTDHGQCGRMGTANICQTSYPLGDYAGIGIATDTGTANIWLTDVDIHGFASRGIIGPIGGDVTTARLRIAFNTGGGWDFDDGSGVHPSTGGTVTISNGIIEWNGCTEEYPIVHQVPAYTCCDQNSAGYGDAIGTANNDAASFVIDKSIIRYNTQDGPDLLHSATGTFTITHSQMYGNMGQQVKLGATSNSILRDNLIVHNCRRLADPMPGAPANYNANLSNFCRAGGDGIALNWNNTGNFYIDNNTFVTYGATTLDIKCSSASCAGGNKSLRNNIFYGLSNPNYNAAQLPGLFCYSSCNGGSVPTTDAMWNLRSNNIFFHVRGGMADCTRSGEVCNSDPLFASLPAAMTSEADLDSLDLHLRATSPARDKGITVTGVADDFAGTPRPRGTAYDIGAYEY